MYSQLTARVLVPEPDAVERSWPVRGRAGVFAERVGAADAFGFVTPEFNHGYPASLKSALDAVYIEWAAKPATFVSYGGAAGGVRAVEQLRLVLVELQRSLFATPFSSRWPGSSSTKTEH